MLSAPVPPSVTSVKHYPSAAAAIADFTSGTGGTITDTWDTTDPIYSVIQFAGPLLASQPINTPPFNTLPTVRPQIFHQLGTTSRVQFGIRFLGGDFKMPSAMPSPPPHDRTTAFCQLFDEGNRGIDSAYWCSYAPGSGSSGTYKIIVGADTGTAVGVKLGTDWDMDTGITLAVPDGELEITNMTVNEGDGSVSIPVVLDGDISGGFTVDVSTADGTATAGQDYTAITGHTLSFAGTDGETQSFTLTLTDDMTVENTETLTFSLSNLQDTTDTVALTTATVTITDNDSLLSAVILDQTYIVNAAVNLTLPPATGGSIPYTYTLTRTNGSSVLPTGLSFNADPATRTISGAPTETFGGSSGAQLVYTVNDSSNPPFTASQTFSLSVNPAPSMTLTLTARTIAEGTTTTYTAVLATQPTDTVTVAITSDNTDVTPTPAALTFTTSDWSTAQTVTITAAEDADAVDEAATLTHTASGGDYASVTGDVMVTVTDNDAPNLSLTPTAVMLDEGSTATYTVALTTTPSAAVTVTIGASNNTEVTRTPAALTFTTTDWNMAQTVTVTAAEDADAVDDAAVTLTHTAAGGDYGSITADLTVTVTVTDNETADLTLTPTTLTLNEGGTATYTAVLDSEPTATVTVTIASDNSDVTPTSTTLTFTTDNWNMAQTLTFTAAEDDDTANDSATLTHTAGGGDYGSITADLTVTVTDNDRTDSEELNEQILSRATQAIASGTLAAMGARVEAAVGGSGAVGNLGETPKMAYRFGGQSSMRGLLQAHGKAMLEGEMDYAQLLDGASFVMPLSATGDEGGKLGALSLWGGTDFSNLDGDVDALDWDGEVVSFHLGVDAPVGNNMLAGLALSLNTASFDYTDNGQSGDYEYSTTNLHPYFGYTHNEKLNFWGTAGFGQGEIEIKADNGKNSTETMHQSLAGGFSTHLRDLPGLLPGGETTLNIKGDVSQTTVDVDSADGINAQEVASNRIRLLLVGKSRRETASGGVLTPSLESGLRVDGGDGETGSGLELNAGIHYTNPNGVSVQGGVHTLFGHDGYSESGADFIIGLSPKSGRGLSLSLQPTWGQTQSTAQRLWDDGINELSGDDTELRSRMDSEVGYGLAATMLGSVGVLTPYTGMTTVDGGVSHVRLGGRFADGTGLRLNLEGVRENGSDDASHTVLLRGELAF